MRVLALTLLTVVNNYKNYSIKVYPSSNLKFSKEVLLDQSFVWLFTRKSRILTTGTDSTDFLAKKNEKKKETKSVLFLLQITH